jgi:NAD(P)-dependent dehydrogenase (short-subunit alcohol dehydrogenase family)
VRLTVLLLMAAIPLAAPGAQQAGAAQLAPGQQVVLVTGSTDGLGREVALRVAATGAHVIVHGRNRERGAAVVAAIDSAGKGSARFYAADLASLDQVRVLASSILRDYQRLDILVNNAGIGLIGSDGGPRQMSADGHEMHFAVNYLAGYLLTYELLPRLRAAPAARIINVSSIGQSPVNFDDVNMASGYSGGRAYTQSKLAQVMFTIDLASELDTTTVRVYSLHPATYMATSMVQDAGITPRSTVAQGAEAVMNLVTGVNLVNGGFYNGLTPARANAQAYDEAARARLRALSRQLTGVDR